MVGFVEKSDTRALSVSLRRLWLWPMGEAELNAVLHVVAAATPIR
jgi:hypothetical protein